MTLRSRLLLLVLAVLLPAVLITLWLVARTYDSERLAHETTLRETTRALSTVVERKLDQRATIARAMSLLPELDDAPDLGADELARLEEHARRVLGGLEGWIELSTPDGRPLAGEVQVAAGAAPNGGERLVRNGAPAALVPATRLWPLAAPAVDGAASGPLRAAVVEPVERDGRVRMNLAVTILPSELQTTIERQRLPADWTVAVLDNRGTVVARQPGGKAFAGRPATDDLRRRLAAGSEALFESTTLDGTLVTGYFSTAANGWTFVTGMPREQYAGRMPRAVLAIAAAALLLLALSVIAALLVARRIASSVHGLERAAADMQAGRPVERRRSGILECDEVGASLADAAESMQNARADLERQVAEAIEHTRAAEQRQSQTRRIEALGRLTGGVAHDFNNLLGVISNSAYLIERHATDQPALAAPVAAVLRSVDLGSRLTQHLVRFAGRRPLQPTAVELGDFLGEMKELLAAALGKRVAIECNVLPATAPVRVDASELELALMTLALNARDAMDGNGRLSLQARNATPEECEALAPGRYVLLTVNDDGHGIEASLAARAFEPFFTTKGVGQGSGLGLPQVHGFAVQAGGTARLSSTPGLGTTVALLLPAAVAPGVGPAGAALPADVSFQRVGARPAHELAGLHLLLVDDNLELGAATAAVLQAHGARVERAGNADEALRRIGDGGTFDLVLSDVVMPGDMDGLALAHALRLRWPNLPVVLISGYSQALSAPHPFALLRKPCAPQELVSALLAALKARAP